MRRWYLVVAIAGLWPVANLHAQQEGLAPTAPVVPAPVLQNGNVLTPSGSGWGAARGPRLFSAANWSPFRNPATASTIEPTAPLYAHPLPPLPTGLSAPEANCGPNGCGRPARNRSCWERIKALLAYHDSPTGLPRCRPTPYITPLQGMFPCTSVAGCAVGNCAAGEPVYGPPVGQPQLRPHVAPQGQPMPMPKPVSPTTTAGAVVMPPRGMQGSAVQATWQGRVVPEGAGALKPAAGPVVPTGYKYPVPK